MNLNDFLPLIQKETVLKLLLLWNIIIFGTGRPFFTTKCIAKGLKSASSLANLLMVWWEEVQFLVTPILEFFWRQCIDDTLLILRGDIDSLHNFIICLYSNNWGIQFTYKWKSVLINVLDLVIFSKGDYFLIRTHL